MKKLLRWLRRAFRPSDTVTIVAVRCRDCGEMLQVAHAEGHACWLEVR